MVTTFLAVGVVTYGCMAGSLTYWHMQLLCSFILPQQLAGSGVPDMIALVHGRNSDGLQVNALDIWGVPRSRTTMAHNATYDIFIFNLKEGGREV